MRNATAIENRRRISLWLFAVCGLLVIMIVVGGLTRLTDSGLSITEWRPVTGAIPPLSLADWENEFEKYRRIPEYRQVNAGMSLAEFRFIYWWEWGHRFLGRFIGVAFLVPALCFLFYQSDRKTPGNQTDDHVSVGGRAGFSRLVHGAKRTGEPD